MEVLPLAQSTVSQHLKVLKEAGWIMGETQGPRTCYCLNPGAVGQKGKAGRAQTGCAEAKPKEERDRRPKGDSAKSKNEAVDR